jgi:hypothetical protein
MSQAAIPGTVADTGQRLSKGAFPLCAGGGRRSCRQGELVLVAAGVGALVFAVELVLPVLVEVAVGDDGA